MLLDSSVIEATKKQFTDFLDVGKLEDAIFLAHRIPPLEIALILMGRASDEALAFLRAAGTSATAVYLDSLPGKRLASFFTSIDPKDAMELCRFLPANGIADVYVEMDEKWAQEFLQTLPLALRETVERLASYEADVVGAIMSSDYLATRAGACVSDVRNMIKALPKGSSASREPIVFVLDINDRLIGTLAWRAILQAAPGQVVDDIMGTNVDAIRDTDPSRLAAHSFQERNLSILPVVDEKDKLIGVVSLEEALELFAQEAVESAFFFGCGKRVDESTLTPAPISIRKRLPWMSMNVFLNLGAVALIAGFENTIEEVPILAAFLPMVTDMGGNVGIQALSVAVRSIALNEVGLSGLGRCLFKEAIVGSFNGAVLGALFGMLVILFERNLYLALAAGIALAVNVLLACLVGGGMPFLIKACGLDPAMMTGPILTTITDCSGVAVYLGLTTAMMQYINPDGDLEDMDMD